MAGVIASSPSPVMSSSALPCTPSPAPRQETDVNADGASEIAQSDDIGAVAEFDVTADPTFFADHLNSCPQQLVDKIAKRKDVQKALDAIDLVVVSKDLEQKLYEPVATLLTAISKDILAHLKKAKKVDRDQRQIVFYDRHRHPLTQFPLPGRSEDYPDIVGVFEEAYGYDQREDEGTYHDIPYHCVEPVVEAKVIYGKDGKAQATRYAYKLQQARPDRPGYYVLSVKPKRLQVIFSSPLKPAASVHTRWTDLTVLCAYIYSLYDPPEGHYPYDHTVSDIEKADQRFGRPSWTVRSRSNDYKGAELCFLGDPWGRRTTVLRIDEIPPDRGPRVVVKEAHIDCDRRFIEADLLERIHEDSYLPDIVFPISSEVVKNLDGQEIVFAREDGSMMGKKRPIVFADTEFDLFSAKSVNDLLMAIYNALEVHRTMASRCHILHRDMSIFNIVMYPLWGSHPNPQKYLQERPRLIDEVLDGKTRTPEERRALCLIIDCDNTAKPTTVESSDGNEVKLRSRMGTPSYIARAVCGSAVHCDQSTLYWLRQMPLLDNKAKELYIKVYGEERYNKYIDLPGFVHGGIPPQGKDLYDLHDKATETPFYHRWEYDAESIFWTMYSALLRVTPVGFTEASGDTSAAELSNVWKTFQEHVIPKKPKMLDTRNTLLSVRRTLRSAFPPVMEPVADLVIRMIPHVLPPYPLMDQLPPHDDHLHEAMERLILQYLVDNRDTPIPLIPHQLRPVNCPDVHAANRGTFGGSFNSFQATCNSVPGASSARGEKRSAEPGEDSGARQGIPTRHSERLAKRGR